jgi:hypothetical protein
MVINFNKQPLFCTLLVSKGCPLMLLDNWQCETDPGTGNLALCFSLFGSSVYSRTDVDSEMDDQRTVSNERLAKELHKEPRAYDVRLPTIEQPKYTSDS